VASTTAVEMGVKVIHAENSLDMSEELSQKPAISAARYHFRNELLVRGDNAGERPSFFKQFLDLRRVERTELMDEPDARVELRKTPPAPFHNA